MNISITGNFIQAGCLYAGACKDGDREATDAEVSAWNAAQVPAVVVPDSISKLQFYDEAVAQGLWPAISAALAGNAQAQNRFTFAMTISRTDPDFNAMASAMGMTSAQVDAFFVAAAGQS